MADRSLGRQFTFLWAAFAVSTFGTFFAFDAFPLIAILVLHAGPARVSLLAAAGLAMGAAVAIALGPWVEFRRKRPVMIGMDLTRFIAVLSVPVAYALGRLSFAQLLVVAVIVASANIAFRAASGAYLKSLVSPDNLLAANVRFEATTWTATALGPPLGGMAIGMLGPVATVVADAVSYLLSAAGILAIGARGNSVGARRDTSDVPVAVQFPRTHDVLDGWRHILAHPVLRALFFNTVLVNGLIMATAPLMAVLMLGRLGFAPWQYGLAFGVPCIGGLIGSRLSGPLVRRYGQHKVMRITGTLRACWSVGLAFVQPGPGGLALVVGLQLGLVTCIGIFNPVLVTYRLERTDAARVARTLSAWSVSSNVAIAALTALWGVLAGVTSLRTAILIAGVCLMATPLVLPRAHAVHRADGYGPSTV